MFYLVLNGPFMSCGLPEKTPCAQMCWPSGCDALLMGFIPQDEHFGLLAFFLS